MYLLGSICAFESMQLQPTKLCQLCMPWKDMKMLKELNAVLVEVLPVSIFTAVVSTVGT